MKNIIVGLSTLIVIALMGYVASNGTAWQGGEAGKIIEDINSFEAKKQQVQPMQDTTKEDDDKLKALKDKAGNVAEFKVSQNYRSKCASCHGVDGRGILGPNLFGQSSEEIYTALLDYKAGRKENAIMKGLLIKIDEKELKELSDEIGSFKSQVK